MAARQPQTMQSSVLGRAPYSAIFQPSSDTPKGNKPCGFLSSVNTLSTHSGHPKKEPPSISGKCTLSHQDSFSKQWIKTLDLQYKRQGPYY